MFQEFNHAFIIHFLKESFNKDELKSVFTTEFLLRVNHDFFLIKSKISVEMADFLLEYIAEKTDFSPDGSDNDKSLQFFFEECLSLLHESKRITLEEIFSKYAHQIFWANFRLYKTWEELTILLLEKIKRESDSLLETNRSNAGLKNEDRKEIDDTALKNLIALLPKEINSRLYLQERDHFCYLPSRELDREVSTLQESIQRQASTEDTEKTPVIQKSDALFDSDYAALRQGIHARYRQALLEKTDDLSIVGDILADAKIAILPKLQNALAKIDLPAESVQSVLTHCSDESFFPSRLALEDILKELSLGVPLLKERKRTLRNFNSI